MVNTLLDRDFPSRPRTKRVLFIQNSERTGREHEFNSTNETESDNGVKRGDVAFEVGDEIARSTKTIDRVNTRDTHALRIMKLEL